MSIVRVMVKFAIAARAVILTIILYQVFIRKANRMFEEFYECMWEPGSTTQKEQIVMDMKLHHPYPTS